MTQRADSSFEDDERRPSADHLRSEAEVHWMDTLEQPEVERIWLSTQARPWRSLALVPASHDASVLQLAYAVSWLSLRLRGEAVGVTDLRDAALGTLSLQVESVRAQIRRGSRVILVLGPCAGNVATLPLVRIADSAILCVAMGHARLSEAHRTVEQIGRERFMGSVIVRASHRATCGFPIEPCRRMTS